MNVAETVVWTQAPNDWHVQVHESLPKTMRRRVFQPLVLGFGFGKFPRLLPVIDPGITPPIFTPLLERGR
ncbi:hypothetical protein [Nocardia sp. NPDC052112]|uniref:hypothetical protein n=1 Tax=Nocardia sp. NPDC052112 TaxID=3155646 RepID=UPI00344A1EC3